jgi:Dolichyl-phosphate-mannose-protein mannosyltransferase
MAFFFSLLISFLTGSALVDRLLSGQEEKYPFLLRLFLGLGVGLGFSSALLFLWLLTIGRFQKSYILLELLLCLFLVILSTVNKKRRPKNRKPQGSRSSPGTISRLTASGFYLLLISGVLILMLISFLYPHGNWDAWAIWNNRARFIFRGVENWQDGFSPLLGWSHPDYPLLLPLSIARGWFYLGEETLWVPSVLALLFALSTAGILVSSLRRTKSNSQGTLAGILLLGTPFYLIHGASQYADIPLAFYFLSGIVLLSLSDQRPSNDYGGSILAGLLIGFSAWTKNEGLVLAALTPLSLLFMGALTRHWKLRWKSCISFLVGLAPVLAVILYHKIHLAPANSFYALDRPEPLTAHLTDVGRYWTILMRFFKSALFFGQWAFPLLPVLILYAVFARLSDQASKKDLFPFVLILLQTGAFFLVFLLFPQDLGFYLDTTLDRLFLQLYPVFLFAVFSVLKTPEEILRGHQI